MYDNAAIRLKSIVLTDGGTIKNAVIEEKAPRIQGFIAISIRHNAADNKDDIVETTRYININSIAGFIIDNEVLKRVSPSYFVPEPEIKIKR